MTQYLFENLISNFPDYFVILPVNRRISTFSWFFPFLFSHFFVPLLSLLHPTMFSRTLTSVVNTAIRNPMAVRAFAAAASKNPVVFMDFAANGKPVGRITFEVRFLNQSCLSEALICSFLILFSIVVRWRRSQDRRELPLPLHWWEGKWRERQASQLQELQDAQNHSPVHVSGMDYHVSLSSIGWRLHQWQRYWWWVHLRPQIQWWEFQDSSHWSRSLVYGQCWSQHKRLSGMLFRLEVIFL